VKNTSLKVPPGIEGTVIDVKVFNRRSGDKDERTRQIESYELERIDLRERQHVAGLTETTRRKIWDVCKGKSVAKSIMGKRKGEVLLEANQPIREDVFAEIPLKKLAGVFAGKDVNEAVKTFLDVYDLQITFIKDAYENKRGKVTEGDDLPPGVIKMAKVYVAVKRKLNVGDKMAGRHGNKGVVSNILPEEDMPFFADGTSMDVVLNPLGVPSRMNIGQIMETHLGWAAKGLGQKIAAMVEQGVAMVRAEMKDVFESAQISAMIDAMSDDEVIEAAEVFEQGHCHEDSGF
jgi:DNA-directed RNA polymerase subunit beta